MELAKKVSIKNEINKVMGVSVFGSLILILFFVFTLASVQVNGPLYKRIIQGTDLIADLLPPSEYIIETYLAVFQMLEEEDSAKLEAYAVKCRSLKDEYESRHDFWTKDIPNDEQELKQVVTEASYRPAIEFFTVMEKEYIPAILNGDKNKARELANGILKQKFKAHHQAIDEAIKLAVQRSVNDERMVRKIIKQKMTVLLYFSSLISTTIIFLNISLIKKILNKV